MKLLRSVFALLLINISINAQVVTVKDLTCEQKKNPLCVDIDNPRLSWTMGSTGDNAVQSAYSIRVATDPTFRTSKIVWKSGKTESEKSVLVRYAGPALQPSQRYYWQVMIWDNHGKASKWSETAYWETGLMGASGWKAKWIEMPGDTNRYAPSPYFRKEFSVNKKIAKAVVYVTAHGYYELSLNGQKVGDQVMTPGWTSYDKRLQYQVYDVTKQVVTGKNAVAAVLGDGWYRGTFMGNKWAVYGNKTGLLMQLKIMYTDGTESTVITDESWKCTNNGAIRMSDNYNGMTYDAGKELTGWNKTGYNDASWENVNIASYKFNLVASESVPVRKIEEIKPIKIFHTPDGSLVADMGQNMVGWIRLKVSGPKGTEVILNHAEVLDKEGEFYTENLRGAKCELKYILSGKGEEIWEPNFTFMGFRYVKITGFPGTLTTDNLTGVVVHSDMTPTGTYECSNPLLNQLQHNIVWGQKGNFLDVPTDCPQRDERLGWTGDAQAFCRTAAFNYDVSTFFTKWLKDLALDQRKGGEVPVVIPDVINPLTASEVSPSTGWSDVALIAPWTMYLVYGDKDILDNQYSSMKAWVEYMRKHADENNLWKKGSLYGDWLFYKPPMNNHTSPDGHTDRDFICQAFYAYSTSILIKTAKVLGKTDDVRFYSNLFEKIKKAFIHEYITPAGRIGTTSQTSYVLALMFDLVPDNLRDKAAKLLVEDIKSRGNHLSTGFLGTPYLCHVLSDAGYTEVAYDLLLQESYPSWLYPVKMGATTIWERWDGLKTDGTFQDKGMNSFNHYAYGAIGDWMYRVSAGLEIKEPGYKQLLIQPHPTRKLHYSKASLHTRYGKAESGWERKDGNIIVTAVIAPNTTATVVLTVDNPSKVTCENKTLDECGFKNIRTENGKVCFESGSGQYTFIYAEE